MKQKKTRKNHLFIHKKIQNHDFQESRTIYHREKNVFQKGSSEKRIGSNKTRTQG